MEVILPELGEGIESATVACLNYSVGEKINEDDDILEVVTDKATFNITADESGIIKRIYVKEGDEAKVGDILVEIEPK